MSDPWQDPQTRRWVEHVRDTVVPMINKSDYVISLAPSGEPDIKFCVELGLSIMLGKKIVVVARHRKDVPSQLWMIAEHVLLGDMNDPVFQDKLATTLNGM